MSDIKAGDLVMVVRPTLCCNVAGPATGRIFVVEDVFVMPCVCNGCDQIVITRYAMQPNGKSIQMGRLIRIDPPALPESVETEREAA